MILDCSKYVGPCRCGREHTLETKKVVVEYNALDKFDQYMDEVGLTGKRAVIYDTNTYNLPTNMEVAEETGISKDVTDIVLPMGATMHMDGSAMSAIIKVAFLFGVFGLDFTTEKAILAIIVAVFSSVAMSGIPGGGGTGELVVCTIFFPDQLAVAYPIALAIGNLVDPPATMVNSAGDYVVSFIVSRYVDGKDWLQKVFAKKKENEAIEQ